MSFHSIPSIIDTPVPVAVAEVLEDLGVLINNNTLVESFRSAMASGEHAYKTVPPLIEEILEENAWLDRVDRNGRRFRFGPKELRKFIRDPEPDGLGTTEDEIRKYLGGSDSPLRLAFERMIAQGPGGPNHINPDRPRNEDGTFSINHKDLMVDGVSATVSPELKPPSNPNGLKQGGSLGYIVRRLDREADKDPAKAEIRDRLNRGEISANAAGLLAGFYLRKITVPLDPEAVARCLARHFTRDQLAVIVMRYNEILGHE